MQSESQDRRVKLLSVPNMRDFGGLDVTGGAIVSDQLFRSTALSRLTDADAVTLGALGIETVYDLRTQGERASGPDRVPQSTSMVVLDVLADSPVAAAANLGALAADPSLVSTMLGNGQAEALLRDSYRQFVTLPSARQAYRELILGLVDASRQGAALIHCTTGKDRTGWAAAIFLWALGADEDVILADYLETNTDLLPALQPLLDKAAAAGLDPDLIRPLLGVQESYLDTAFTEAKANFGSMDGYFTDGLGLSTEVRESLRSRFIA